MSTPLRQVLQIRVKQSSRLLNDAGPAGLIFACVIGFVLFKSVQDNISTRTAALCIGVTLLAAIASLHRNRKDREFLSGILPQPAKLYYLEYFLLLIPFIAIYACSPSWYLAPFLPLLLPLVMLIRQPAPAENRILKITSFIPPRFYEWSSGIRARFWYIVPIYLGGLILSFTHFGSMLAIGILSVISIEFYSMHEPVEFFIYSGLSPRQFIYKRIRLNLFIQHLFFLPLICCTLVLHSDSYPELIYLLSVTSLLTILCILIKYASYSPDKSKAFNPMLIVMTGFLFYPTDVIIPLLGVFYYDRKAVSHLSNYLSV